MGNSWYERAIIGEVKAVAEYTCGHTGRVTVYVIEGQKATSGVLSANSACPTCDKKWEEERYERLRKYPAANRDQAFNDAVCSGCGGPADHIGGSPLQRGESERYWDLWEAYCEFCFPHDGRSRLAIEASRFGLKPFEYRLLCTIDANKNSGTGDLDASIDELVSMPNQAFNPRNDQDEKTFSAEEVRSMLDTLEVKGKLSVTGDQMHSSAGAQNGRTITPAFRSTAKCFLHGKRHAHIVSRLSPPTSNSNLPQMLIRCRLTSASGSSSRSLTNPVASS